MNKVVTALLIILSAAFITHSNVLNNGFLEEWDDFLRSRYPTSAQTIGLRDSDKKKEEFRNYEADAKPGVREFYRLNHR